MHTPNPATSSPTIETMTFHNLITPEYDIFAALPPRPTPTLPHNADNSVSLLDALARESLRWPMMDVSSSVSPVRPPMKQPVQS
ncbi:hypothetical protein TrLO_g15408 [Triparma laevis f. longispina]|uniref:Uncharacterized protein n=1 Tax=Triparma laevis f. longispina TaxID=1714387 RepID=A0A9W7EB52_9STRA|nr:hypothetical protein TrLO_g15408 [Triparma laevis f. longispina]